MRNILKQSDKKFWLLACLIFLIAFWTISTWTYQFIFSSLLYFSIGYLISVRFRPETKRLKLFFFFLIPFLVLFLIPSLFIQSKRLFIFPIPYWFYSLLSLFLGFSLGKVYTSMRRKVSILIAYTVSTFALGLIGIPNWINFVDNPDSQYVFSSPTYSFSSFRVKDRVVNNFTQKGKITVIDFWTNSCRSCFESFPAFEKLYEHYLSNPRVDIISVNIPDKGGRRDTINTTLLKKLGYEFPIYLVKEEEIWDKFRISGVPTIIIMDMHGEMVYKGSFNYHWYEFYHNIYGEINRVLDSPHLLSPQ